jgi:hypothetical protein
VTAALPAARCSARRDRVNEERRHAEEQDAQRCQKRFKVTGSGKVMREQRRSPPPLEKKPSKR